MPSVQEPKVCVVIAAYNSEATIIRAVLSALAETEVAEVIVVDDASTDNTVKCALSCDNGSGKLKVLLQGQNGGPSPARNRAIRESVSPWITILDSDDFFLPGRIKGMFAYTGDVDMIADDLFQVPENAIDGPPKKLLGEMLSHARVISLHEFVLSNVTASGENRKELGFIKPLIRRQFLEKHGICYQEHMRLGEDFELYARALAMGARLMLVPAQGYVSVVRAGSLSGNHSETDLLNLRDCSYKIIRDTALTEPDKEALRQHRASVDCRLQWRLLIIAVKNVDIKAAIATFLRPYPVPLYLMHRLMEQLYLRASSYFKKIT